MNKVTEEMYAIMLEMRELSAALAQADDLLKQAAERRNEIIQKLNDRSDRYGDLFRAFVHEERTTVTHFRLQRDKVS